MRFETSRLFRRRAAFAILGVGCAGGTDRSVADTRRHDRLPLDEQFRASIRARDVAFSRADSAAVHRLISDSLVWVDGTGGGIISTPRLLAAVAASHGRIHVESDSIRARRIGDVVSVDFLRTSRYVLGKLEVATTSRASELFVPQNGGWLLAHHTQVWIPTRAIVFALDSAALNAFVGRYEIGPGYVDDVHWSGGKLVATATGEQGGATLVPVSATVFRVGNDVGTATMFERDGTGRVVGYVSHWPDGHVVRARKLP